MDVVAGIAGIMAAAWLTSVSIKEGVPYKLGTEAKVLIEVCEKDLPRNEICILVAVKEKTSEVR